MMPEVDVTIFCSDCGSSIGEKENAYCTDCYSYLEAEIKNKDREIVDLKEEIESLEGEINARKNML